MRCLIGLETSLAHLSDQNTLLAVEQWARLHPARAVDVPRIVGIGERDFDAMPSIDGSCLR